MDAPARESSTSAPASGELSSLPSAAGRELAARLFVDEHGDAPANDAIVPTVERLFARLFVGLSRWFGPYGTTALLTRALARAQANHNALAPISVSADDPSVLIGRADSVRTHGAALFADGIVGVLAALADLIGRLIGNDLATNLLEQSVGLPGSNGTVAPAELAERARQGGPASGDVPPGGETS
jgi:limonene-1,2-epoxide hydrolase